MQLRLMNNSRRMSFLVMLVVVNYFSASAQQVSIPIESKNSAILLQTDKNKHLKMVYNGAVLTDKKEYDALAAQYDLHDGNDAGTYNNAYSTAGTYSLTEPAMQVTHADGNMSLDLKYISHEV